jgi:hypothetical protein
VEADHPACVFCFMMRVLVLQQSNVGGLFLSNLNKALMRISMRDWISEVKTGYNILRYKALG